MSVFFAFMLVYLVRFDLAHFKDHKYWEKYLWLATLEVASIIILGLICFLSQKEALSILLLLVFIIFILIAYATEIRKLANKKGCLVDLSSTFQNWEVKQIEKMMGKCSKAP